MASYWRTTAGGIAVGEEVQADEEGEHFGGRLWAVSGGEGGSWVVYGGEGGLLAVCGREGKPRTVADEVCEGVGVESENEVTH